ESPFEARIIERFHEVVEGPRFKRPQCILIVSRYKNNRGREIGAKQLQDVKPVDFRHLNIDKQKIGWPRPDEHNRLSPGGAFTDFYLRVCAQEDRQIAAA